MIKVVIFDMDGVLIDSVEVGFQARKKLLAQYGVNLDTIPDSKVKITVRLHLKRFLQALRIIMASTLIMMNLRRHQENICLKT